MSEKDIAQELSDLKVMLGDLAIFLEDANFVIGKTALDLAEFAIGNTQLQAIISTLRLLEHTTEDYKELAFDEEHHADRIKKFYESERKRVITC
ncbi:TPA_asm: hypothetical protein GEV19_02985 [Listeria monocytogenes]|nr:hypothetical protein [Listeria monocytogenes]